MKRSLNLMLCAVLLLSLVCPVLAVESQADIAAAAEFVRERRIMVGNQNGDMNLDSGLTRAELATILTRIHGENAVDPKLYIWACYFTDVPNWAKPYVGYCVATLLMNGYNRTSFGPNDAVTPAAVCTVMLRVCGIKDSGGAA